MKGYLVIAAAVVIGLVAAVAVVVVGTRSTDEPDVRPAAQEQRWPPSSERAPEAEDPGDDGLGEVDRAARRFLAGYLPLIYAQPGASPEDLDSAAPALIAELAAQPGRVPPGQAALEPDLERLSVVRDGPGRALAVAQINDGPAPSYSLSFYLQETDDAWLVTRIGAR